MICSKPKTPETSIRKEKNNERRAGRTESSHVLAGPNWLEADEGDLHTREGADCVPRRVRNVESAGVAAHENEDHGVNRDHVGDERVST